MIEMRFGPESLARLRFAMSPLTETMRSLRVLDDRETQSLHAPWAIEARRAVAHLQLDPLRALLQPFDTYTPDFISPPPASPLLAIEDELAVMRAVPPAQVRDEVHAAYRGRPVPSALAPLLERPARGLAQLAELVLAYWEGALAAHWPRLQALLSGDITYRARRLADGGAELLFADIDPCIEWIENTLRLRKVFDASLHLDERGALFIPSAFVWPRVVAIVDLAWQPAIIYPARGVGSLWELPKQRGPDALARLMGRGRAEVLAALDQPTSTTELAHTQFVSAGGVSQHLTVLRDAGLVHASRTGRVVLYRRTALGNAMLESPSSAKHPSPRVHRRRPDQRAD